MKLQGSSSNGPSCYRERLRIWFDVWDLQFLWRLDVGIWDFSFRASAFPEQQLLELFEPRFQLRVFRFEFFQPGFCFLFSAFYFFIEPLNRRPERADA